MIEMPLLDWAYYQVGIYVSDTKSMDGEGCVMS
jgi:hypothetical protein